MTTFYLDYVNGNDAADGSTFALGGLPTVGPWKTITGGPTAARIAPGDVIKIAKSPDPTSLGQTALFTNLSRAVVLQTGAVTAHVSTCDHAAEAWTNGTNGTCSSQTSQYKMGADNGKAANRTLQIVIGAAASTTELLAYRDLGAGGIDFSGYQQLSFWIRNSAAILDNQLQLVLCSDQSGAVAVDTLAIPAIPSINQWVPLTIDKGSALGSAIKSVALYSGSVDPGTPTLLLDNILACKAASADDSLTLQSLISKNSAAQGGTEPWYCIQSINGTSIYIDNHTNQLGSGGRGYTGDTETVTIYKRETIKTAMVAYSNVVVQQTNEGGAEGSVNEYQGGYDTSSGSQDGETFFDGLNGFGYGMALGQGWSTINRLNGVRYQRTFNITAYPPGLTIDNTMSISTSADLLNNNVDRTLITINNLIGINAGGGLYAMRNCRFGTVIIYGSNQAASAAQIAIGSNSRFDNLTIKNSAGYALAVPDGKAIIKSLTTADNAYVVLGNSGVGPLNILASSIGEASITNAVSQINFQANFKNFNGTVGDHRSYRDYGEIYSQKDGDVRHTASGLAWKLMPKSANRCSWYPLDFKLAEVAVNANAEVTVKAWLRRSHADLTLSLVCRGGQIAGVANDVATSMTAEADTWEEVTITFTPTEAGVVEIEVWAYGATTYSGYVDDMSASQSSGPVKADLLTLDRVKDGLPWCFVPAGAEAGGSGVFPIIGGSHIIQRAA